MALVQMYSNTLDLLQTQKKGWAGPVLGVKQANENRRNFDKDVLKEIKPVTIALFWVTSLYQEYCYRVNSFIFHPK